MTRRSGSHGCFLAPLLQSHLPLSSMYTEFVAIHPKGVPPQKSSSCRFGDWILNNHGPFHGLSKPQFTDTTSRRVSDFISMSRCRLCHGWDCCHGAFLRGVFLKFFVFQLVCSLKRKENMSSHRRPVFNMLVEKYMSKMILANVCLLFYCDKVFLSFHK